MPKNLIVIVADTLRHPCYLPGYAEGRSMPFLRALESRGVSLSHVVASSSWTPPSHASLLSGIDPWRTGFHLPWNPARPDPNSFLAALWRSAGGKSAGFSANWMVAPEIGTACGYDAFNPGLSTRLSSLVGRGLSVVGFEQLIHLRLLHRTSPFTARWDALVDRLLQAGGSAIHRAVRPFYSGEGVVRAVDRFLRGSPSGSSLHLFVNLMEMHEPYVPSPGHRSSGLDPPYLPSVSLCRQTDALRERGRPDEMMGAYLEAAGRLDRALLRLIDTLRLHRVLDDAGVMLVSDHGQGLGENDGYFGHGSYLYDELVRVPAIWLEFRNGQAIGDRFRWDRWVDLRHLYDLLRLRGIEGLDRPVGAVLDDSLAGRGPASSFWAGPAPHPPRGFFSSQSPSTHFRAVRVFSPEGEVWIREDRESRYRGPALGAPDALVEYADRAIARGSEATASSAAPPLTDPELDRRLRSWGYD